MDGCRVTVRYLDELRPVIVIQLPVVMLDTVRLDFFQTLIEILTTNGCRVSVMLGLREQHWYARTFIIVNMETGYA